MSLPGISLSELPLSSVCRHVKALESRSQLLDAALASADEANRRWEECRALVDQLRVENAALRAALAQGQMLSQGGPVGGGNAEESKQDGHEESSEPADGKAKHE